MHSSEENIISSKIWYIVLQKDWKWRSDCLFQNLKETKSRACCFHIRELNEPNLSSNFLHLKTQHFDRKIKIFIIRELTTVVQITVRSRNLKELDKTDLSSNFLCNPNTFRHFIAILEVKKGFLLQKCPMTSLWRHFWRHYRRHTKMWTKTLNHRRFKEHFAKNRMSISFFVKK